MTNAPEAVHREPGLPASDMPARDGKSTSNPTTKKSGGRLRGIARTIAWVVIILALAGGGYYAWLKLRPPGLPEGFASGNGRIEGTEIDVDAKIPGRIVDILVDEGDFVDAGQVLVHMEVKTLDAQQREAQAKLDQATISVETANAVVRQREAERTAAIAQIGTRKALWEAAAARLARVEPMAAKDFETKQSLDDARAAEQATSSAVSEGQANLAAAEAAISAAKEQVVDAKAAVIAAQATIDRVQADIDDSSLKTPRAGRVQYKVAEQGEVLPAGRRSRYRRGGAYRARRLPRICYPSDHHLRRQRRAIHSEDRRDRGGATKADVSPQSEYLARSTSQIHAAD